MELRDCRIVELEGAFLNWWSEAKRRNSKATVIATTHFSEVTAKARTEFSKATVKLEESLLMCN